MTRFLKHYDTRNMTLSFKDGMLFKVEHLRKGKLVIVDPNKVQFIDDMIKYTGALGNITIFEVMQ